MNAFSLLRTAVFSVFLVVAACGDDDGEADFCTCTDRVESTPFGFGESCALPCSNWIECATGNTTAVACEDAGPTGDGGP